MRSEILVMSPQMPALTARLRERYTLHLLYECADAAQRDAMLDEIGARIEGVVTGGSTGIDNGTLARLPALRIVAINGIGTDAVDLDEARRRGLHVSTTPDVLTADVADLALALLLAVSRDVCVGDRYVREGRWGRAGLPLSHRVSGRRVGIVGLGRVGRAIAQRLSAFDCPIAYTDLRPIDGVSLPFHASLRDLARDSEVLVLAASADSAEGIVDAAVLDALGPRGILINVARGKLVKEDELVDALRGARIAGAGLDVFVDEPRVPEALLAMDNVVLQPHRASATEETRLAMGEIVLESLAASLAGERPRTSVTP